MQLSNSLLKTGQPPDTWGTVSTLETRTARPDCIAHTKHMLRPFRARETQQTSKGQEGLAAAWGQAGVRRRGWHGLAAGPSCSGCSRSRPGQGPSTPTVGAVVVPPAPGPLGPGARPPRLAARTSTLRTGNTIRELCGIVNMNCFDLT